MELVRLDTARRAAGPRPAVTVGNFDGVHRGHQALVAAAVAGRARARRHRGGAHLRPASLRGSLSPDRAPAALMTLDQKAEVLAALGVDVPGRPALHAELARAERRGLRARRAGARRWARARSWWGRASASAAGGRATWPVLTPAGPRARLPRRWRAAGRARGRADQQHPHPRGAGGGARWPAPRALLGRRVLRGRDGRARRGRGRTLGHPDRQPRRW